ncbi:hypothetical protein DYBT9275_06076 [Dyadobacter sp. CECT 9275]|uniref:Alpha glucuronidase N-terminal domain-containing protein n=1 Tax=Dyadobacter helix TaxID=2822344 RepID=A0A916JHE6_9BACT|nr:hypothetical protein [Dyadobacter sp. CECT 9275]CAG5018811.1 hypothetical protein DYBT9275_06076 [Dyadobacter sp. CECT 9275]
MHSKIPPTCALRASLTACFTWLLLSICWSVGAQSVNLKNPVLVVSPNIPLPMRETAAKVLAEEIGKRTDFAVKTQTAWPKAGTPVIALVMASDTELNGKRVPAKRGADSPEFKKEGYRVVSEISGKENITWIIGADARGILFGSGWLLRNLRMDKNLLQLDEKADFASSPDYPIRGHQLGYRTTANTYDAWSVAQFDQYIRELAIFGTNAIEGIPFQEGQAPSPHFKIPSAEMRIRMSEICQAYDMDYWLWTPGTFDMKTEKDKRAAELQMHEDFYKKCPRLDHIFFPGGDPGDNHPSEVMPFLKELQSRLVKYHPNAKVWISLQGFSVEQIDYFYHYLETEKPTWLQGVVSGPGSPSMAETRYRLPKNYQHREYPDITHSVRCEFPVEKFDQAYALTLGRESVNPRPYAFAKIHEKYAPFTDGFVSYSDGSHDDFNKVLWSMRAWDIKKDVHQILKEYASFFFGKSTENTAASGIEALEQNWKGPLAENGGVEMTYLFWKNLEAAHPKLKNNWRWQMLVHRAYYDQYTRLRLIYEQELEKQANEILNSANVQTIEKSMELALKTVNKGDTEPIARDIRKHLDDLSDALYITIGYQTSTAKHKPKSPERGVVMDFVDYPLNNRWWLTDEFERIRKITDPDQQLAELKKIVTWENPGPGSYYDDISSVSKGPRVKTISDDATDVAWWDNGKSRKRLSSQLFQREPELDYENLDPQARYRIRVCGYGDALLRVDGKRLAPVLYNKEQDSFKEWIVPLSLTQDGKISVTFDGPEESELNWRKNSKISDIWLLKQ